MPSPLFWSRYWSRRHGARWCRGVSLPPDAVHWPQTLATATHHRPIWHWIGTRARSIAGLFSRPSSGRVENWRAHFRARVSSRTLSSVRWVHNSPMVTFPTPASSNGACGFPALRFPVRFTPRVMGPLRLGALSAPVVGAGLASPCPGAYTDTASSTSSSRSPAASVHASDAVAPSFPPTL